jgi:hypothetical protein
LIRCHGTSRSAIGPSTGKIAGTIQQAKETYDGFEQVGVGVVRTMALRQVRMMIYAKYLHKLHPSPTKTSLQTSYETVISGRSGKKSTPESEVSLSR